MSGVKLRQPETQYQAAYWQRLNNEAVAAGFCVRCAAQYGYGRQHGWAQVHPPCLACRVLAGSHAPSWYGTAMAR